QIYVHLQALVGGEEVIAAGSDSVAGLGSPGPLRPAVAAVPPPPDRPELAGLAPLEATDPAALAAGRLQNIHTALVDETVASAAFMVSWHDPARPVRLSLVSPSLAVITPASAPAMTVAGSSYVLIRIDRPEP